MIQACEGVGEAHARGIIHRDIKPENLFVLTRSDGWRSIKVLDFGISKTVLLGASAVAGPGAAALMVDMSSRETQSIMGSPYYMSPEQLRSTKSVDHRADVWSLGIVLFELLTGVMPFELKTRLPSEFTDARRGGSRNAESQADDLRFDVPYAGLVQSSTSVCKKIARIDFKRRRSSRSRCFRSRRSVRA